MSRWVCRLLPHEDGDGPANMARDEALLDLVAGDPSGPALRTYGWSEPTLSLGYFQPAAGAGSDPRWRGAAIVRRPTGGGALVHDRELTYALAVPAGHPLARESRVLYRAVHDALAGLLSGLGADARRRGDGPPDAPPPGGRPFLCFADRDPDDVVVGPFKVVGSAQRRRSGAVLQHGSVLLARSPLAPELPGAADLGPLPADPRFWSERLRGSLPGALGADARPVGWPDPARDRAAELERDVYRNSGWTFRR